MEEQGGTFAQALNSNSRGSQSDAQSKANEANLEQRNYKSWASYMPGLSIIRNHVINPLLVATEKVVEQYIPVQEANINQ